MVSSGDLARGLPGRAGAGVQRGAVDGVPLRWSVSLGGYAFISHFRFGIPQMMSVASDRSLDWEGLN